MAKTVEPEAPNGLTEVRLRVLAHGVIIASSLADMGDSTRGAGAVCVSYLENRPLLVVKNL
jgi:hypothetical protein